MAAYVTYGRTRWRAPLLAISLVAALAGISACSKLGLGGGGDEMGWARAALERNDRLEVIAADPQMSTFTVRVKDTGELRMVRADQVVAGPPGVTPPSAVAPAAKPSESLGTGAAGTAVADAGPADGASGSGASEERNAEANTWPANATPASQGGPTNASGARTGFRPEPAPRAEVHDPNSDVASITPGGRTLEAGPGYAIKTASISAPVTARPERERSSTTSAVERRHEPIVCQGNRLVHIDNQNLEFDGDAVTAEDGCEIHITNSHITAKGVGVSARAANVHIDNSQIEGDSASIDASEGAQVYAASSKFKGLSRRLDNSAVHDLGGNIWN